MLAPVGGETTYSCGQHQAVDFKAEESAQRRLDSLAKVERLLNWRPRKSLGFQTPNEVFHTLAKRG